jgi:DNA-binding MarR family transcriptional regulator
MPQRSRQELLQAVNEAIHESSTLAVFFHTAIAAQLGLGATDTKALFLLSSRGPLTAGEIAQHTGLTTASVTSLIDRLESSGFARRVRDTNDRRRVIVESNETRLSELTQMFGSVQETFAPLLEDYSDEQLATIANFLTRFVQHSQEMIATLAQKGKGKETNSTNP